MGLFPYTFTASSHLTFTVALALPLWLGHILYAWFKTPEHILAHLVPLGTPYPLIPFIVLIESVRNIIRPLTLSVRLAANIVAGHLLLTLLSSQCPTAPQLVILPLIISLILLGVLESAVALIQAYVFRVLRTLYVNEVNSSALRN
jgi:F-type H+-transporting ATPase subunit a